MLKVGEIGKGGQKDPGWSEYSLYSVDIHGSIEVWQSEIVYKIQVQDQTNLSGVRARSRAKVSA